MKKRNKCESCDDECNNTAKYECEECGTKYCKLCAEESDFICNNCYEPPQLIRIKK